ncbi:MAG: SusE domain-containing protein, partial [Dehalococcoidales bacterium]|nr:SusE domain-containing protein [Dehalococcoidales bacterium]
GTITKTQTFTVEASTPPVPQPVSPQLYSTLKDNVTFDWNPVTYDIMDVTYELQLARDASFTTPVISKTGLTATEYTLTAAEKLEKAGEDNPYFWRVRAVDEAGNESAWTSAAEFYYGSGWPTWLTWLLIGLGVVVLGILAFWVGRRIAYYSY